MNKPTIKDELTLESWMVQSGMNRYAANIKRAREGGHEDTVHYSTKLMKEIILPLSDYIIEWCCDMGAVKNGSARALLRKVLPKQAAYITLQRLFSKITKTQKVTAVCAAIGSSIEDEARFTAFKKVAGDSVDAVIAQAQKRGSKDPRYIHRVLTYMANNFNDNWASWTVAQKVKVGAALTNLVIEHFGLFKVYSVANNGKPVYLITPTEDTLQWIKENMEVAVFMRPAKMPTIIPPEDWISYYTGGYWNAKIRDVFNLVKVRSVDNKQFVKRYGMERVRAAINTIQQTPWRVNKRVHDILLEVWDKNLQTGLPASKPFVPPDCPYEKDVDVKSLSPEEQEVFAAWKNDARAIYNKERERKSKCLQLVSILQVAGTYRNYERFYFPMQADFRGRLYSAVPGFSPQGPNFGKGVLEFADGMKLGKEGAFWFLVNGANLFGYDKASYKDRVKYIMSRADEFKQVADDPLSYRDVWGVADKPWQFLAWLFEFRKYLSEGESMISHIPIGLDGSCNGLQHFSAMLRDKIGGTATNLVPSDKPNDIYARVADRVVSKLKAMSDDPTAKMWLAFGIDRKLVKPPVMTLPYGSTRRTCTISIFNKIKERGNSPFVRDFKAALWLTPYVWDSIGEIVVAARQAMKWLRTSAAVMAKANEHIEWITPSGFPMYQKRMKTDDIRILTVFGTGIKLRANVETDELDSRLQQSGCSPNFVHSMDASHLCLTTNAAAEAGIMDFAMIHDDFGTHAANTPALHRILREQFVNMYKNNDVLAQFKEQNEKRTGVKLPDLPSKGELNIEDVKDSLYFFG